MIIDLAPLAVCAFVIFAPPMITALVTIFIGCAPLGMILFLRSFR